MLILYKSLLKLYILKLVLFGQFIASKRTKWDHTSVVYDLAPLTHKTVRHPSMPRHANPKPSQPGPCNPTPNI